MNTKLVILIEGGLIQEVIVNGPVEVLTLDHDIEGGAPEHIRRIQLGNSGATKCYVRLEEVTVNPPKVARLWKAA